MQIDATQRCSSSKELLDSLFAKADVNGDKTLSIDEFSALLNNLLTNNLPASDSASASDEETQEKAAAKAAAFSDFDSDADGKISEAEMKAGLDSLAKALTEAVAAHNAGNSISLVELLFGKGDPNPSKSDSDKVAGISVSRTEEAPDRDNNGIDDSTESIDTRNQRLQQWMLDAFASQFSVSAASLNTSTVALAA